MKEVKMEKPAFDELLITHLGDIDASVKRIHELEEIIGQAIGDLVANWVEENGFIVEGDSWNDDDLTLHHPSWDSTERSGSGGKKSIAESHVKSKAAAARAENIPAFYLEFGSESDDDCDYFWLTRICRAGQGIVGFRFGPRIVTPSEWKRYIADKKERFAHTRFEFDKEDFLFLPVETILPKNLTDALANEAVEDALTPISDALDHIHDHIGVFDKIISELRELP